MHNEMSSVHFMPPDPKPQLVALCVEAPPADLLIAEMATGDGCKRITGRRAYPKHTSKFTTDGKQHIWESEAHVQFSETTSHENAFMSHTKTSHRK